MAIEKGNIGSMYNLGHYYKFKEINYDLMKKYYLMAINEGSYEAMVDMDSYYNRNSPNNEDMRNYFNSLIKRSMGIEYVDVFNNSKNIEKNRVVDLFCSEIDNNNLTIKNFEFCLLKIINYINFRKFCESCESCELKNIKHFATYINKLLHCKNKLEYKKCASELFKNKTPQIFMEYLDLYYYEYLKKIFAPGGKGYIKTKKHFELVAKQ
ncbi:MAG: hypothetical protein PHO49_04740 [Candidatus Nanoarchaeia archaeon]|nr:hypothetical protein [Candidatus Nanoarchaeia archaeon]